MLKKISNFVTVIVYNSPKPPKEYKINKGLLRILFISLPSLVILSIVLSTGFSLFLKNKIESVKSEEPALIKSLRAEILDSKNEYKDLEKENKLLIEKVSMPTKGSIQSALSLFSIPQGFSDKQSNNMAKVENFSIVKQGKNNQLRFDILNNSTSEQKLGGYIHIIQYSKDSITLYPENEFSPEESFINFSKGESFNVARFRPVIADFKRPNALNVWYKVYIFSKTGDLITFHTTEKLEVK